MKTVLPGKSGSSGGKTCFVHILLCCCLLALTASCAQDYMDQAVEKARELALEQTKDLTEQQRNHIRYTLPVVYTRDIFKYRPMDLTEYDYMVRNTKTRKTPNGKYLSFIGCHFAWDIPGVPYSVIVVGNSQLNGRCWEPVKVICRRLAPEDIPYENARKAAVNFAMNFMQNLSVTELNRIRFSEAKVCRTEFNLSYIPGAYRDNSEKPLSSWESYLADLEAPRKKKKNTQYSLVWKSDDPKKVILFTGVGNGDTLSDWSVLSARTISRDMLDKYVSNDEYLSDSDKKKPQPVPDGERSVQVYRKNGSGNIKAEKTETDVKK